MRQIHKQKFALSKAMCFLMLSLFSLNCLGATSYRVTNGTTQTINESPICKKVTNNTGLDIFVPTNTGAEWTSFYSSPPAGVAIANCPTYHLTPTGRVAPFYDICYYNTDAGGGWAAMRCNQATDIGAVGTLGGCQMNYGTMTTANNAATIFWSSNYFYNWETVYKCEYY